MGFHKIRRFYSFPERAAKYFGMLGRGELFAAAFLVALLIILSVLSVLHQRFNSDEAAHLHIIWAWTRGQVQYRDVFSNNMPLFHLLFAPILGLLGERATILYWMRFILLPTYFVTAWCTYKIGARLFSRRAGIWAIIGLGLYGAYRNFAFEFRADNLWTAIWLLCVVVVIHGAIDFRRSLVAGFLFGFCFAVSMKSVVLLVSLLLSALVTMAATHRRKIDMFWRNLARNAAAFLGAALLVPAAVMIFFALKGVWRDFQYGVFDYNLLAERLYRNEIFYQSDRTYASVIFLITLVASFYVARCIVRNSRPFDVAVRRAFVLLLYAFYVLALHLFWPPISRTYLPIHPLAFVLGSGALLAFSDRLAASKWSAARIFRFVPIPIFVSIAEIGFLVAKPQFWKDGTRQETRLLRSVIALTSPDENVLDCKGETIFRTRTFRPVLERIEMRQIEQGIMIDNAPERCIETQTHVAATLLLEKFSMRTRQFVKANYLPVGGDLSVAGKILRPSASDVRRADFDLAIPARYEIILDKAHVSGMLDASPYDGPRFLVAGHHTFESASEFQRLTLLWAQAVDRGFRPRLKKIPRSP